jgi:hypothetical protein
MERGNLRISFYATCPSGKAPGRLSDLAKQLEEQLVADSFQMILLLSSHAKK